ncbi:MAG: riboflavin synthase, partial [Chloroflexota bacterium]
MFTGIIEEVGTVQSLESGRLAIKAQKVLEGTKLGDSIAVNGACLTVVALGPDSFSAEVMPETLRRTNLGGLRRGGLVNLERALALGDRLGGHMVQGHVEGAGKVLSLTPEAEAVVARFYAPSEL